MIKSPPIALTIVLMGSTLMLSALSLTGKIEPLDAYVGVATLVIIALIGDISLPKKILYWAKPIVIGIWRSLSM